MNSIEEEIKSLAVEVHDIPFERTRQIVVDTSNIQYPEVHVSGQYDAYGKCVSPGRDITLKALEEEHRDYTKHVEITCKSLRTDMPAPPVNLCVPIKAPTLFQRIKGWFRK